MSNLTHEILITGSYEPFEITTEQYKKLLEAIREREQFVEINDDVINTNHIRFIRKKRDVVF